MRKNKLLAGAVPLLALLLACVSGAGAREAAPAAGRNLIFFDNDFAGPGESNIQALVPLLRDPGVELVGIGVVTGDAWLEEASQHALRFLEIAGRSDIPVAKGAQMPLLRTQAEMRAWEAHYGPIPWKGAWTPPRPHRPDLHPDDPDRVPPLPEGAPHTPAAAEDAAHLLIRQVRAHPGQVTVLATGPLTNIALAVRLAPDLPRLAKGIVIQGGYFDQQRERVTDNADYATDFNFIFDPEAAHIVLTAPWPRLTLVGPVKPRMTEQLKAKIAASGTPVARYFSAYAKVGQPLWDELTAAIAVDPSLVKSELVARMDVDVLPGPNYGGAMLWKADKAPNQGEQEVHIVDEVDTDRFLTTFATQAAQ